MKKSQTIFPLLLSLSRAALLASLFTSLLFTSLHFSSLCAGSTVADPRLPLRVHGLLEPAQLWRRPGVVAHHRPLDGAAEVFLGGMKFFYEEGGFFGRGIEEEDKKKTLQKKLSFSLSHLEAIGEDPLRLFELRRREGEPGVLVAAEGLELESRKREREERERGGRVEKEGAFQSELRRTARKERKKNASFEKTETLFSYPLDVRPHLFEQSRGLGGSGVGAALEVGLCCCFEVRGWRE